MVVEWMNLFNYVTVLKDVNDASVLGVCCQCAECLQTCPAEELADTELSAGHSLGPD